MRIVLLGCKGAGKSSAGNIILGQKVFDFQRTAKCVKRQWKVAEKTITIVEAPGWWWKPPVEKSTEFLKQEIVLSVSLCPPGPHVVLLVVSLKYTFLKNAKKAFEGYLNLLGERVWSHAIVLFTFGDLLGDTTIEQYIEKEGEALQWLVQKCGNRYHVFNNENRDNDTQVTELLEKIEEMVERNSGCHFEMDANILQEVEERRKVEIERSKERMMMVSKLRADIRLHMCDIDHLSELRIVLLGYLYAGTSSAGNTILGKEAFNFNRTVQCVKRQGEVAGRQITVVEAPGWWSSTPVEENTELLKREIVRSVSYCPPGPHAVLVIMQLEFLFKENERKALEGYLNLLGERVWSHAIVLFTHGDWLGDTTIEQYIECERKALQWLVEKCGNRYHVLNNQSRENNGQITELMDKIEEMVAGNSGQHFEMDTKIFQEVEERRGVEDKKSQERMMNVSKQRKDIRSQMGDLHHLSELRIVLMGRRNFGKSSVGNTILGKEEFDLQCVKRQGDIELMCVKRQGDVAGKKIVVVEAPGWWNEPVEKSTAFLKQELVLSQSLCPPGPHAVLLVMRLDYTFKENERKVLEGYLNLLGERVWSHAIVLFTFGDWLEDTTIEQYIECERNALQWLVEKCGNRYHVLNNKNRAENTQITELMEKIEEMVAGTKGHPFELDKKMEVEEEWTVVSRQKKKR